MAVNPCWDIFKKDFPDIHNYLKSKTGVDFDGTDQSKQSFTKAAKELQNQSLSTLNDVYAGLGIEGFQASKPTTEIKQETKSHSQSIKTKFREQFKSKGIEDEQIDAAVAIMDARANSWASEEDGRKPEEWYNKIADVKSGEFESGEVQYQGGKLKAAFIGAMTMLQPMKISDAKAEVRTEQTSKSQSKEEKAIIDILNNYYKENDETPPTEVVNRALYLWDKFGRPEIVGDSTKNDDRAFATNEGGKIKLGNITNFDDFVAELSHSAQYVSGRPMDDKRYATEAARDSLEYKRKGSMEQKAHDEVEPILADYIFTGDSSKLNNIQYKDEAGVKQGAVETLEDGRVVIHALQSPDVSTMVHEIAHVFEKDLTAPEQKIVTDFGGSEAFARGFERYLRDGESPNAKLKTLFDKFKNWLSSIYKSLKGSPISKKVSPEIKQVFDRLLTKAPKAKSPKEEGVMKKARGIEDLQEPVDIVMQYFAGGNKINPSAIQELFGGKDQRLHQQKGTGGEHRSRISLIKKDAPSIKDLAHSLWESSQDENGNSPYTDQGFRNAIEQVLGEHNSPSSMAKALVSKYLTTAVTHDLTEAEAAEMDAGAIAQIDELLADLPQKHKDQLLGLLRKYQDKYGIVDWESLEKDINGFTPNILSLPLETQRALDGLVKKYYASGENESSDVLDEDNSEGETEAAEVSNAPPTQSTVEAAKSAYDKAVAALKKAEDKISKQQSTQGSLLPSEGAQGAMFGVNRDEAKTILDPLRQQVKETKAALEAAQKSANTTQGQPELPLVTKPTSINGNEEKSSESSQEGRQESGQESSEENVKTNEQGGVDAGSVAPPLTSEKIGDPARAFADKLRKGKISKLSGFKSTTGFDAIWDAAVEVIAKAIDAGAEIADAIQEGLLYIKKTDWYKQLTDKKAFDKQFTDHFNNEIGEPPSGTPPTDTHRFSNSESSQERVRGAYNHLMESKIPEGVKDKFRAKGIKYKVSDNGEAQAAGKAIISSFGTDEALRLARMNTFHPSVNSAIFSEAINDFYDHEQLAKTPKDKFAAATRWADTYNEYAELLTASGQFGQYAFQFYKTSPLGFILSAKERLDERRRHFLERDEKSLKEAFEFLKDLPEFQEIFSEEVQEAVKKSKNEIKKETRKKISDAFDKLKLQKNATYATFVPPPIINGAIEAMKQAVLLGYEVADVISEGIKYINVRHKEGWNQDKFESDFTPIVSNLIANNAVKTPSAKDQKKILDKWDRKLSKLDPEKRKELLSKALAEIVKNGGLDYEKFKEMYADALGLPSMTPEMETKLRGLGDKLNEVDKAKENLDKDPSEANVKSFLKAMKEGEKASRQLNDMLGDKGITLDRFLSIAKLNTLGVANLFINPFFNISFMPIRFLESMVKTGLDYGLRYAGFARSDGLYENTFYKQRGYFQGFGKGFRKSIINLYTGDQQFDYFQKTTRQNIQPIESVKEILSHYKGTKRLTTSELANAVMEAFPTMGASAAIISRGLQVGDLPFRFAAERGAAENIASQRGLTGIKKEAFILNPDEESKEKITDAGQRAVMAQDNLLTGALNRLSNYLKFETQGSKARQAAVGIGKIVVATTQPFLKIPLNSAMTTLELAIPEFAVVRGFYHAATGNRELALNAFARAAVGYAIGLALTQMTQAGLVTGTDDDKDKINASIYKGDYVGDKTLNYTGFKRWILGGSPRFEDGDVTISLNVLGVPGAIMQMQAQKYDKMSPEQWEQEGYLANLWERAEGSFVNGLKNNVFGNASTLFSAINDGSTYGMNKWLRGSSNVMLNAFEPQWLSTASRISDKYKADYSAMNLPQQMAATLKERFWNGDDVPKQITVWGQKRTDAPKGTNPFLHYYVDITKSRNVDVNDFGFNILGLYNRTKDDAVIPSRPQKTLNENGQYVRLSPLQYEELQIMVGTQRKQLVQLLMNTDHYNDADDKIKTEMLKKQYQNGFKLGERQFWFKHPDLLPPKKKK